MLKSDEFWSRIEGQVLTPGPQEIETPETGALLLVVLTSWKYMRDQGGDEASELGREAFEGVCAWVLEAAPMLGLLDTTTIGAYYPNESGAERGSELVTAQFPLEVSGLKDFLSIEVDTIVVPHDPTNSAEELYGFAQAAANDLWRTVPKRERHHSLTKAWDEVVGKS